MDEYFTVPEAAKKLSITVGGIHHLIRTGTIQAKRKGNQYFIHPSELEKAEVRKKPGRPRGK